MLLFEMKKEALPIGTILNRKEFGDLHWYDEQRCCELHGPYMARVVFARDEKRSNGFCPECRRIQEEKDAKARAAVMAKIEAEREQRRIEEALGRACIPADFHDKSFGTFKADTDKLKQALDLCKRFVAGWQKARKKRIRSAVLWQPWYGKESSCYLDPKGADPAWRHGALHASARSHRLYPRSVAS